MCDKNIMKGCDGLKVIKRDGREVEFDKSKIRESVLKAYKEIDGEDLDVHAKDKAAEIARHVESLDKDLSVEEIQDIVENKLMASNRKDVARAYIIYRSTRSRVRERNTAWMKAIKEKLFATNVQNQNANVEESSFGGRKGEADAELLKKLALDDYMSETSRDNHLNNEVYIHDLCDWVLGDHNCLSVPFDKLLANGFNTRQTDVRPAQSVSTAFQLVAVLFQLQSLQQFGGVSATHLDWTMVPYVRKSFRKHYTDGMKYFQSLVENMPENHYAIEYFKWCDDNLVNDVSIEDKYYKECEVAYEYAIDMTEREVHQSAEAMYHNLNTL